MKYTRAVCLLLAVATLAPLASASEPQGVPLFDDGANARADDLTRKGTDLAKKHRWPEAEAMFRQAWGMKHSYDIGGNLGVAELALGKYREAAEHLLFGLKSFPANGKPEHRDLIRDSLAQARAEVATLTVEVSVKGATVFVDGRELGVSPLVDETFVDPGKRTIEAKLPGYTSSPTNVDVGKGTAQKVTLVLSAVPSVVPTAAPSAIAVLPPPPKARPRWPAAVTGGVSAASLVAAVAFTLASNGKRSDGEAIRAKILEKKGYCSPTGGNFATDCEALSSASSSHDTFHNLAIGGYLLAGGAAVATVAILLASQPSSDKKTAIVRVAPLADATCGGAVIFGSF
jgi:tetratricopeptide (TPR) repeat protein